NSRIFVASAGTINSDGTVNPGGADVITSFTPAGSSTIATGLGSLTSASLPNFGPTNPNTGKPSFVCSYRPDFLTTAQAPAIFIANYGVDGDPNCNIPSTDSVAVMSIGGSNISNIAYLPAGSHPVAMTETSDLQHLYVVNQGNNTVTDLSPVDL